GVFRHSSRFLLFLERLLAQLVPAFIKLSFVSPAEILGYLVRSVRCSVCDISEERPIGRTRLLFADPCDRPIRQIFGKVITFLRRFGRIDASRPVEQDRRELVHFAAEEAVEFLKSAACRPAVERSRNALLPRWRLVAFAEIACVVAVQF